MDWGLSTWPDNPSAQTLVYWQLRRDKLCPSTPEGCAAANRVETEYGVRYEECAECLIPGFEYSCTQTGLGMRVAMAAEVDSDLEMGLRVDLDTMSARQHSLLKIIRSEKLKLQSENKESEQQEYWRQQQQHQKARRGTDG